MPAPIVLRPALVSRIGLTLLAIIPALVTAWVGAWYRFGLVVVAYVAILALIARRRIVIDGDGVRARRSFGTRVLRWDDIDHYTYWSGGVRTVNHGVVMIEQTGIQGTRHVLTLHGRGGPIRIDSGFYDAPAAIARVLGGVHGRLGARTAFPPFELADDGLHHGGEVLPWSQLEMIKLDRQQPPSLRVMKHGKVFPWAACSLGKVHNSQWLLESLADRGVAIDLGGSQLATERLAAKLARGATLPRAEVVTTTSRSPRA